MGRRLKAIKRTCALAALAFCAGCYLPPIRHTAGEKAIAKIAAQGETRDSIVEKLGPPDVIRTRAFYVYAWKQSFGYIVIPSYGFAGPDWELTGKAYRALFRFEGDRVVQWDIQPVPSGPAQAPVPSLVEDEQRRLHGCIDGSRRCFLTALACGGSTLAALDRQGNLTFWSTVEKGEPFAVPAEEEKRNQRLRGGIAVSPDGNLVAVAGRKDVEVWDVSGKKSLALLAHPEVSGWTYLANPLSTAFSPDGRFLVAAGGGKAALWETTTWKEAWSCTNRPHMERIQFTPDSRRVIVAGIKKLNEIGRVPEVFFLDAGTGAQVASIIRSKQAPPVFPLVPTGQRMLVASAPALETWDLSAMEKPGTEQPPSITLEKDADVPELLDARLVPFFPDAHVKGWADNTCPEVWALSPDGALLAQGWCGVIRLLRLPSGEIAGDFRFPDTMVRAATFSPDGRKLFVASGKDVRVFDVPPLKQ